MLDPERKSDKEKQKEKIRQRYRAGVDPNNYRYIPPKKQVDYHDNDVYQRIAIYVRVSTDSVSQTTSFELQQKYYEDFVNRHPNWELVGIYADEGISGTSLKHREQFKQMIADCKAGKIDMIITKSVSRFARNVEDFVGTVRNLAELNPRVGVFFESEYLYSLDDKNNLALSLQASMAQEESHIRSRSMEVSLRMRLDHGLPITPALFGYTRDDEGNLIINPDEAPMVKLMFYMYILGFSTTKIAEALNKIECRTYHGNERWQPSVVYNILRNERHCGDVLTQKTFTLDFISHKKRKNNGDKPQSWYYNHHEAIVSRDDFLAVQKMIYRE